MNALNLESKLIRTEKLKQWMSRGQMVPMSRVRHPMQTKALRTGKNVDEFAGKSFCQIILLDSQSLDRGARGLTNDVYLGLCCV